MPGLFGNQGGNERRKERGLPRRHVAVWPGRDSRTRAPALLILCIIAWWACSSMAWAQAPLLSADKETNNISPLTRGSVLAHAWCATCHVFADPDLLDKKTWKEQTLPRMKIRMGLSPESIEMNRESALLKSTGLFPEKPMLSAEDFQAIVDYFVATAPELPLPQPPHAEIIVGLPHFKVVLPRFRIENPATTLLQFSEKTKRIYVGDAERKALFICNPEGELLERVPVNNIPVSLAETEDGFYLTSIGHFIPSEDPLGSFVFWQQGFKSHQPALTLLEHLPRPTYAEFADLNGDGKPDFVLCMFGNMVGRFSWFENLGNDQYKEHVLLPKAGALRAVVRDFNGDGIPDIAALFAQELESLIIFINDGHGNFTHHPVFQKHPIYGHTYFELADFNHDGKPDFLVTNGDNGEYPSPLKRYHGIRIYMNKGNNEFEEAFFYPLDGAFKAVARDFAQDGNLDIAAISFFPDYRNGPRESFVYLQNHGGLNFTASTFRECIAGRWITMDVGDVDGDGKLDILLGSCTLAPEGPGWPPEFVTKAWEREKIPFLILKNTLK